jgi:hypothetical protein
MYIYIIFRDYFAKEKEVKDRLANKNYRYTGYYQTDDKLIKKIIRLI